MKAALRSAVAALPVALAVAAPANQLNGIRLHDAPESTRVVLDTRDVAAYKLFAMKKPERVVVDLRSTGVARGFSPPKVDSKIVRRIRTARRGRGNYRVVLDLRAAARPKVLVLKPIAPYGHRLVIDLYPVGGAAPPPAATRPPDGQRMAVVALDAGHGGEDPGAVGVDHIYEKNVVLAIARQVKRDLDAMPGISAQLVRTGDYYISLRGRTRRARQMRADLFVSIHADAFRLASVRGASAYALSERGATSEEARLLAAGENRADLIGGVEGAWVSLDDKDPMVAGVLVDMAMNANMAKSLAFGEAVLGALGSVVKLHKRRVEQAGFAVLKSPDVPSILVETGFLSNPNEARSLATGRYQRQVAGAIATGIQAYLLRHPPQGTLLASMEADRTMEYVVKRGDTLSEIAQRHRVRLAGLKALNGIVGERIRIGQVLVIPPPGRRQ